jgi:hypothetical protein
MPRIWGQARNASGFHIHQIGLIGCRKTQLFPPGRWPRWELVMSQQLVGVPNCDLKALSRYAHRSRRTSPINSSGLQVPLSVKAPAQPMEITKSRSSAIFSTCANARVAASGRLHRRRKQSTRPHRISSARIKFDALARVPPPSSRTRKRLQFSGHSSDDGDSGHGYPQGLKPRSHFAAFRHD